MTTLAGAVDQMISAGMPPFPDAGPRVNTSAIVRYGPKKRAWYRLYEFVGRNGQRYITGAYGYWGVIESAKIETDWQGMDELELVRVRKAQAAQEEREREKRAGKARFAAGRARQQWMAASFEGKSPYLERKGLQPERGVRFASDGTLYIPMLRYDEVQGNGKPKLVGLQKIAPDGTKLFNKGMAKQGAAFRLGTAPKDSDVILVAEGYATGLSVRAAIDRHASVYCAFDCYNAAHVARMLRAQFPASPIVMCADDDFLTVCPRHDREGVTVPLDPDSSRPAWCECNPGRTNAKRIAGAIGMSVVAHPHFVDRGANKWTDFNDLHAAEGVKAVGEQIERAIAAAGAVLHKGRKAPAKPQKPSGPIDWDGLFARFTLIYPTDTAWDATLGEFAKIAHMKLNFGDGVIKHWLDSQDRRRTVNLRDVVFDPKFEADTATTINLFTGIEQKPSMKGSCAKLLELLTYLCGEAGQDQTPITEWVLKWTAYPLQHVGAKMATAIVMHGAEEGAGKGLFWGAVRDIYGKYGALIMQDQLESPYNAWISRKLFMMANEVISRQELRHHVGRLKNLITESPLPIREIYMPMRYEVNFMNLVFLTNELHALQISPFDRRYQVIRTPCALPEAFYKEVVAEIAAGGVAALYQYLLEVDTSDFYEHTKPVMTAAKADLIDLGLNSAQLFQRELHDGLLHPLVYGPCFSTDLYRAYSIWCVRNGIKNPMQMNKFSAEFMAMNGVRRKVDRIADPDKPEESALAATDVPQRTVFNMGDIELDAEGKPLPDEATEKLRTLKYTKIFRVALRKFARNDSWRSGSSSGDVDDGYDSMGRSGPDRGDDGRAY